MRTIYTVCLLVLLSSFCSVPVGSAQDEQQDDMTFTTLKKTGATRTWQTDDVRVTYDKETKTLSVVGYYAVTNPDPENPTQEMTLLFRNFDGPGTYSFSGGRAKWEDRNSGSGLCTYLSGDGEILGSSQENPTLLSGTFNFRCESQPRVGDPFWTDIEGTFSVNVGVEVLKPEEDEVLTPGEKVLIEWSAPLASRVDIYYVFEDPQTDPEKFEIKKDVDATLGSLEWIVTDSMSPQAWIVIVDPLSPEELHAGDQFSIRGPHLARIAYDPEGSCPECPYYVTFYPSINGWNVNNGDFNILDPAGRSDSRRFDYSSATDPYTGEKYAKIFTSRSVRATKGNYPPWESYVLPFGVNRMYGSSAAGASPIDRQVRIWGYHSRKYLGSCYGLSALSALFFVDAERTIGRYPNIGSLEAARAPYNVSLTPSLVDNIDVAFAYQFGASNVQDRPTRVVAQLEEYLSKDETDELMFGSNLLCIVEQGEGGGAHALTAYRVEKDDEAQKARIYVYDSNRPGDDDAYVAIDLATDSWSYSVGTVWQGTGERIYLSQELRQFFRPQASPRNRDSDGNVIAMSLSTTEYRGRGNGSSFSYTSESGFSASDNQATPLYRFQGPGEPYAFVLDGSYNELDLVSRGEEGVQTMLLTDSYVAEFWSDAPAGEGETLRWGEKSLVLTHVGETEHALNVDALFEDTLSGRGRTVGIRDFELHRGDSIEVVISEEDETITLLNRGVSTSYEVLVRQTGSEGLLEGGYRRVDIESGARHRLAPVWDSLAADLPIYITDAGGGEDSILLGNLLLSVEEGREITLTSFSIENPVSNEAGLQIGLRSNAELIVAVSDMRGADRGVLFSGWLPSGTTTIPLDLSDLPVGVYILTVEVDGRREGATIITTSH